MKDACHRPRSVRTMTKERRRYSALRLQELSTRSCISAKHCSTWLTHTWRMRVQCVPGSSPAREPGNDMWHLYSKHLGPGVGNLSSGENSHLHGWSTANQVCNNKIYNTVIACPLLCCCIHVECTFIVGHINFYITEDRGIVVTVKHRTKWMVDTIFLR